MRVELKKIFSSITAANKFVLFDAKFFTSLIKQSHLNNFSLVQSILRKTFTYQLF